MTCRMMVMARIVLFHPSMNPRFLGFVRFVRLPLHK